MIEERKTYTDRSKREVVILVPCTRCFGKGYIWEYRHVKGGICFKCGGLGGFRE